MPQCIELEKGLGTTQLDKVRDTAYDVERWAQEKIESAGDAETVQVSVDDLRGIAWTIWEAFHHNAQMPDEQRKAMEHWKKLDPQPADPHFQHWTPKSKRRTTYFPLPEI